MPAFALTIFTGAFLLFQVQPLIGKYILPWFGGSPGVWTTCMLFFQLVLLAGYAYAHALGRRLPPRTQAVVHLVLLAAALALLPITPSDAWKPRTSGDPTWHILALLAVSLGLPYFVLAATGPLMQEWFRRVSPGASPYRLYALSNLGSLLALVSYPFYFETHFTRQAQARFWSLGLVVYAVGCGLCAWRLWRQPAVNSGGREADAAGPAPSATQRLLWVGLPACASILLLAVTNKMCQDVAVIPFLWVLPLALYLLSFIICFDSPRWYSRFVYTLALAGALVAVCEALFQGTHMGIVTQVVIYAATLFVGSMVCHGELYRLKPHPRHLTAFYLMIAAGGAIGGLFVALVAPYVFDNYYELHLALVLTGLLLGVLFWRGEDTLGVGRGRALAALLAVAVIYGLDHGVVLGLKWLGRRDGLRGTALMEHWAQVERWHWIGWLIVGAGVAWALTRRRDRRVNGRWLTGGVIAVGLAVVTGALLLQIRDSRRGAVLNARNFYGVLSVFEHPDGILAPGYFSLQHGRITHGIQFAAPDREREITSYFGPHTGLGLAVRHFPRQQNQRIGLIGLGVGTIAAYGKPGDYLRIYEINPQVKEIADTRFTYVARSEAKIDVVMGDGRLSLENEDPQNFDLLIMDAFSSDAVPVHLLTKEAFQIYQRHLKPDGAIVVNISNRYLDLYPVVENAAREFGYEACRIDSEDGDGSAEEDAWWLYSASWVIVSRNQALLNHSAIRTAAVPAPAERVRVPLWTDDYTSMFRILQ